MNYQQIKDKKQKDYNELFTNCGVFWAFSNEQFAEGVKKTPLQEGDKYLSIGAGGYMPKSNLKALQDGTEAIDNTFKREIKEFKMREKHILYELNNHECYYTLDIKNAVEALGDDYTTDEVLAVFKKFKANKYSRPTLSSDYITA